MTERRAVPRLLRLVVPPGLFVLAVVVRAAPWREVLAEAAVYPFGNDAYYHLRRIVYTLIHFPATLEFDPYINFPNGAKPIWTPVLDWCIAALAWPWVPDLSSGGLESLERFAVWVPPVLGALTVVSSYFVARRFYGFRVGLVAGLVLSVLSGHYWYSQIGFVDHHVAVALVTLWLLASGMTLLDAQSRGDERRAWAAAAAVGATSGLCLIVWPGTLLHVGLVHVGLAAYLLTRPFVAEARRSVERLALSSAVALAVVAPFCLGNTWPQWTAHSPLVLSDFQPLLFAALLAVCAIARGGFATRAFGATRRRRVETSLLAGGLVALGVVWLAPDVAAGLIEAWTWMTKSDAFQARVSESNPLFVGSEGEIVFRVALVRLSAFVFLLPAVLLVVVSVVRRERHRTPTFLLVGWTAGLLAVTLAQRRFFNSLSVALALVFALSIVGLHGSLPRRIRRRHPRVVVVAFAALGFALIAPTLQPYLRPLANEWGALRGERVAVTPSFGAARAGTETGLWLRAETPVTAGWINPGNRPEYGVLAPWPLGHLIKYVGRRPTVVDNFGDDVGLRNFAWARAYYFGTEAQVMPQLEARRIRYVVSQRHGSFLGETPPYGTLFHSLYFLDGSAFEPPPESGFAPVAALERHRLVFESRGADWSDRTEPAVYKVYEIVKGARVIGRARPGARVDVELDLRTNRRRKFVWRASTFADAAGEYRLRLPYSTHGDTGYTARTTVRPRGAYRVLCEGSSERLFLAEHTVRDGRRTPGPRVCPPPR